jgi:predicted nucleic acid-binding protein
MGIILDTSVLIAGERRGESVREIIERLHATRGEQESAFSVVTLVELTHGIYRAKNDADPCGGRLSLTSFVAIWQCIR